MFNFLKSLFRPDLNRVLSSFETAAANLDRIAAAHGSKINEIWERIDAHHAMKDQLAAERRRAVEVAANIKKLIAS